MRPAEQVFVVERTHRAEQCSGNQEPDPFVAVEKHPFQAGRQTKALRMTPKSSALQQFQPGRPLAQNQNCAKQRPQRTGGANGRTERQRQVFERKIGEHHEAATMADLSTVAGVASA